jgi:hypothetical protein
MGAGGPLSSWGASLELEAPGGGWLESDPGNLAASLARFVGSPAYGPAPLREDLARLRFLLGVTDGQGLFTPDELYSSVRPHDHELRNPHGRREDWALRGQPEQLRPGATAASRPIQQPIRRLPGAQLEAPADRVSPCLLMTSAHG